jgi:hypothetical protein
MMKITLAAVWAAFACASTTAFAVPVQCAKHDLMVGLLAKKYKENPIATGTVNQDRFMQLFVSLKGTWTILMTKTDGEACIVAAGENWETMPSVVKLEPAA